MDNETNGKKFTVVPQLVIGTWGRTVRTGRASHRARPAGLARANFFYRGSSGRPGRPSLMTGQWLLLGAESARKVVCRAHSLSPRLSEFFPCSLFRSLFFSPAADLHWWKKKNDQFGLLRQPACHHHLALSRSGAIRAPPVETNYFSSGQVCASLEAAVCPGIKNSRPALASCGLRLLRCNLKNKPGRLIPRDPVR